MGFPPSTYTAIRHQARAMFGTPWYYPAQYYQAQYHQAQYHQAQYYPVQQYTPAPAIPEIVLTTPEGENIHGDAIPRGNDICGYTPEYHYQQIQFYENCEHNLLPVKPHHQRSMIQNAVYQREQHERDELEEQYERDMEFLETDSEWKRMHPEYSYNEVYSLCSNDDTENHNNNNNKSAGHADSAPVESQTTTKNKRPYSLTTSWSEISTTNNKRHKTATEKALMREEKQKRERERANLTDKAQTARRLSAELKAKMNRSGIGRDEMDKLRKQDEMVQQKLKKYGDEILSLYDEDMLDDNEEDDDDDDDWEDPMVFEMDEEVGSDGDWEIL